MYLKVFLAVYCDLASSESQNDAMGENGAAWGLPWLHSDQMVLAQNVAQPIFSSKLVIFRW
jgi:hypothetical protein